MASSSKANCTYITDGSNPILLDVGLSLKQVRRALDFQTSDLIAALVTHSHSDHCRGVPDLLRAGIDCYMTEQTVNALGVSGHRVNIINPLKQFVAGPWTILPFPTVHDVDGSVGFLVVHQSKERLLYLTDTMYCKYKFNSLNFILIEANFADDIIRANVEAGIVPVELKSRIIQSHFSLANVKEFLRANDLSRVEALYLLHLSNDNSDAARFKREIQDLTGKPVYIA